MVQALIKSVFSFVHWSELDLLVKMLRFKFCLIFFKLLSLLCLSKATCPPNSTPGKDNGKCYSFLLGATDFNTAEMSCNEFGGHLVSICNAFENNFLDGIIRFVLKYQCDL